MQRIVVVGAGLAGARVCEELRARGYDGALTLLGREPHAPYDRPPLSKAVLLGAHHDTTLATSYDELGIDLRTLVTATGLRGDRVSTSDGDFGFDALVIATGATPRRLSGDDATFRLRTVDDALRLRAALVVGARVVVVGAGWIGAEVATAAAARGCQTTVVEAGPAPLSAAVGAAAGMQTARWYAQAGVTLRLSAPVAVIEAGSVTLANGERLPADVVVVGVGVRPELGWLAGSAVAVDSGVLVDEFGRTTREQVFAVGDCTARWSPRAGRRVRGEHWDDALHAPEAVAATMLGEPTGYDPVPYFWSEQFGHYLQWVGWRDGDPTVWRQDGSGWAACWLDAASRLTGFLAADRPRDLVQARKAIAAGKRPDPARLADPSVAVRDA